MSGGRFNYVGEHIKELMEEIGDEAEVERRFPLLAEVVKSVGDWVAKTEEVLDKDLGGERELRMTDRTFDLASTGALLDRIFKLVPEGSFKDKKAEIERWEELTRAHLVESFVGERYPRDVWVEA